MIKFRDTLPSKSPILTPLTVIKTSCFERETVVRIGVLLGEVSLK